MARAAAQGAVERYGRSAVLTAIDRLTGGLNAAGSAIIFLLMCVVCADVVARSVFNAPILGVTEIVEMSIVVIVFLQLADTTRRDKLTRADSLLGYLRKRRPGIARLIDLVAALAGLVLMGLLAYATIPSTLVDFQRGHFVGTPGMITFPIWPSKLMISIGMVLAAIQLVLLAARAAFAPAQPQEETDR